MPRMWYLRRRHHPRRRRPCTTMRTVARLCPLLVGQIPPPPFVVCHEPLMMQYPRDRARLHYTLSSHLKIVIVVLDHIRNVANFLFITASSATSPTSPPPPPPPFGGRPMPPPTSPRSRSSTETTATAPMMRTTSQPPGSAKDLKPLPSGFRPGSSMSISSMLGTDVEPAPRDSTHSSRPKDRNLGSYASPTTSAIHRPFSPHRHPQPPLRELGAPANGGNRWSLGTQNREVNERNLVNPENADMAGKGNLEQQVPVGIVQHSQLPRHIDTTFQKTNEGYPLFKNHPKSLAMDQNGELTLDPRKNHDSTFKLLNQSMSPIQKREPGLKSALDLGPWQAKREDGDRSKPPGLHRVELSGVDNQSPPPSKDPRTEKKNFLNYRAEQGPRPGANYPFLARAPSESPPDASNGLKSSIETPHSFHSQLPGAMDDVRDSKYSFPRPSDSDSTRLNGDRPPKQAATFPWKTARDSPRLNIPPQSRSTDPTMDSHPSIGLELPEQPKSSLGLRIDENRRGRVSPLPQAVQGAQARLEGPATEPNIKNEFARIFPGIGSGVGSNMNTPAPPDSTTPMSIPSSPIARTDDLEGSTPFRGRGDFIEMIKQGANGKKAAKRSKKVKDESGKAESSLPKRTGEGSTRGTKRHRGEHHHHSRGFQ